MGNLRKLNLCEDGNSCTSGILIFMRNRNIRIKLGLGGAVLLYFDEAKLKEIPKGRKRNISRRKSGLCNAVGTLILVTHFVNSGTSIKWFITKFVAWDLT